jgi:hypothetical protein
MVDGSHHHVFASGGTADDAVAVLNLRGKGLDGTPRPARHGTADMVLSGDGSTLYVALSGRTGVSRPLRRASGALL